MGYELNEQERKVLMSLVSGYTERETYLRLNIPESEFAGVWQRIKEEFEGHEAQTTEGIELREAYHRVERRRLEAELWASEARLAALMDTASEAILLIEGGSGRIVQVNNQTLLLLGYSQRDLIGATMEMLVPEDLRDVHVKFRHGFLNSVRKREMGYHPPIQAVHRDGHLVDLEIALTATSATDDVMVVCKPVLEKVASQPHLKS